MADDIGFERINHTADIGIRVRDDDLQGIFSRSARSMFAIIAERKQDAASGQGKKLEINLTAQDIEGLFINWLNELLSLSAAKYLIFSDFKILSLSQYHLHAQVYAEDVSLYRINSEIKAATYHQLKLQQTPTGWLAEVIFDV